MSLFRRWTSGSRREKSTATGRPRKVPWGLGNFGSSYRAPAPRRLSQLTLEDLVGALGEPAAAPAPRPAPVTNLRDLQGPDRRQAQSESLWAGLAALGANLSGDRRGAVAGIGDIQAAQDRALAGANARQEAQWQAENEQRATAAADSKRQHEASALYGMYQRVTEGEAPEGPFAERAETAARAGSMAELTKLDAERPMRDAARAKGYNPDAFAVGDQIRAELEAETKRLNDQKAWDEGEKTRLTEREKVLADAEVAKRLAQRNAGVLWEPRETPAEAAAKADAVERVRARYASAAGGGGEPSVYGGKVYKQGEKLVLAKPPDAAHPNAYVVPLDGQPADVGNLRFFTADGTDYVMNKDDPNAGAYEMKRHQIGDTDYPEGAPVPFGPAARSPVPFQPGHAPAKPSAGPAQGPLDRIKAAAGHAVDFSGGAPAAPPKKAAPAPKAPAAPSVDKSQQDATKKLSAVQDPAVQAKIRAARAAGYSEGEIAAYLGIH